MTTPALPSEPASTQPALARDSLFAERVRWTGAPKEVIASVFHRALAWLLASISIVSTLLAIAASQAGHGSTGKLVLFAAWAATFALAVRMVPVLWAQAARFTVTDRHVIWQCGKLKRSIQRDGISFARITWHRRNPRVGDLDLVRAVPTGALHRRLTLTFQGVSAPHRVWAIIRGAQTVPGLEGGGDVALEKRLDEGEEARWSTRPLASWRSWLPMSTRRTLTAAVGGLCMMASGRTVMVGVPMVERLIDGGIAPTSIAFMSLIAAVSMTVVLLMLLGVWLMHVGITRKPWLDRQTEYLVTNHRVIIKRGRRELHVDRHAVVDLAERDGLYGGRDVFLVLDGPQSRALSAQGAFGPAEGVRGFRPMLQALTPRGVESLRAELARR